MARAGILKDLITELDTTIAAFERKVGIPASTLSRAISRNSDLKKDVMDKIKTAYPQVRMGFLETGKLPRLEDHETQQTYPTPRDQAYPIYPDSPEVDINKSGNEFIALNNGQLLMLTRVVTVKARAGYLTGFADPEFMEELPIHPVRVSKRHKGRYLSFIAEGDSMTDDSPRAIEAGDTITARLVDKKYYGPGVSLHLKEWSRWIIVSRTEGILVKQIIKHDVDNGILTLHSYNSKYEDQDIRIDDIYQLWNVVGVYKPERDDMFDL